jgi:hypothetical protein
MPSEGRLSLPTTVVSAFRVLGPMAVAALCFRAWAAPDDNAPTFSGDAAPILFKNCTKCHRPGEIASTTPFVSYESVRPWAKAIKEKILKREMPPWPADPNGSLRFRNDSRLSKRDIDTLVAWVNAGSPKGGDTGLPPIPNFSQGWLHPKGLAPDAVVSLPREFLAPARGEIPYLTYLAKIPYLEDKWIAATQTRPGNRALVHHMAITEIALNNGVTPADLDTLAILARQLGSPSGLLGTYPAVTAPGQPAVFDMLGVYTPGTTFEMYREDTAKLLKGGSNVYLDFNIHYQATGRPEKDQSMIGLWFRAGPPKHQLFRVPAAGETIIADGRELLTDTPGRKAEGTAVAIPPIPPYAENYELIGITAFTEPVTFYQFDPHAHLRAKDFSYTVVYPDGREEYVLSIPKYDFNWQLAYELDTPLKLPAGSKLVVTAHYDNSRNNRHNPGPEKEVYFREGQNQSSDEMFTPFVQYTIDTQDLTDPRHAEQNAYHVVEMVGCLENVSAKTWMLTDADDPTVSKSQATSAAELKAAEATPFGNGRYQLLGAGVFRPSNHKGNWVAIKGVLIKDARDRRINITSLQTIAPTCPGQPH